MAQSRPALVLRPASRQDSHGPLRDAAFICLMAGLLFLDRRQRSQTQDICPVSDVSSSLGRGVDPTIRLIRNSIFWVAAFVVRSRPFVKPDFKSPVYYTSRVLNEAPEGHPARRKQSSTDPRTFSRLDKIGLPRWTSGRPRPQPR